MEREVKFGSTNYVLGKKYRDTLHGYVGIATAAAAFINGCNQLCLVTIVAGDLKEAWIDVQQLEPLDDSGKPLKKKRTKKKAARRGSGGPQSTPPGPGSRRG